jgi:coenzyme F420-dependent glucose-6-phosphate dehydrogenase
MASIFYHASHEQFSPSRLLQLVILAEKAGFDGIHSSDHFHPWSVRQGQSGFSFSWIAAALQATNLPYSMVCAPGQRYHPAIVAQAVSTLSEMFPGRINFELGSGEALNEMITGQNWPEKEVRNRRLLECVTIIRRLLNGEEVSFNGEVIVKEARLYTLPQKMPLLLCAALSKKTSGWAGSWADGLLTTAGSIYETMEKIASFRQNGGTGKPIYLQFSFSYANSRSEAINAAYDQWRSTILPPEKLAGFYKVEHFDKEAEQVTKEDVANKIPIFTDIHELMEKIETLEQTGMDRIILHNVNRSHEEFLNDFKEFKKSHIPV